MFDRFALCFAFALTLGLFGGTMTVSAQAPAPVIIDSDMISDDWMAALYVLNDPHFDVKALTVSGTGFAADCDAAVAAGLGILALADAGNVPVACGAEKPLVGENAPPAEWRTTIEMVNELGLPASGAPSELDAVALFTATVQESPEPITVLALGPLTNIGAALEATPSLIDNIAMIYVMGGAVDVPGSQVSAQNTTAEWNIYSDPHAARLVFESGVPITLVPLDATNEAPVTPEFVTRLETAKSTPVAEFIATLLANNAQSIESGGYFFWDPLAAAVMADPGLVTLTPRSVTVVDSPGDPEDGRIEPDENGAKILVATAPDAAALETALIAGWNG